MKAAFDAVLRAAIEFDRAMGRSDSARQHRDIAVRGAERRLNAALGGMPLVRWRNLVDGRGQVRSVGRGREIHLARAIRDVVEAALGNLARARAAEQAKVAAADRDLADTSRRLIAYGPAASALTGRALEELQRLARARQRPPPTPDG